MAFTCFPCPPLGALAPAPTKKPANMPMQLAEKKSQNNAITYSQKLALQAINDPRLIEYHPEIAFMQLNQGLVISESKKSTEVSKSGLN